MQDPLARDELLEDIFDGLELLRESNMLADWLVASIAAHILSHPKVTAPAFSNANVSSSSLVFDASQGVFPHFACR